MHIKMHISCRNRKQYEQRNCKTIHTQSIHRKGTVPIPPTDESAGFLGTFFIEEIYDAEKSRYEQFYVELQPLQNFYEAEEYHQHYLDKHPDGYCHITLVDLNKVKKLNRK